MDDLTPEERRIVAWLREQAFHWHHSDGGEEFALDSAAIVQQLSTGEST